MKSRDEMGEKERIVVKVGTSTLSFPNGKMNYTRLERLAMVLSDLQSDGKEVILVSSGAVGVGAGRLKMYEPPTGLVARQALAAVGQADLIRIYQKFFDEYNQMVAQVLLTRDGLEDETRRVNARNTIHELLRMKIIPVINENDTVSTAEVQFGDNDNLSAKVAILMEADLLIILSDVNGLYSGDPHNDLSATRISMVSQNNQAIEQFIHDSISVFGTGGMATKVQAARLCMANGVDACIINGKDPKNIFRIICGMDIGTLFLSGEVEQ
jgi:glutamate 5-kinase